MLRALGAALAILLALVSRPSFAGGDWSAQDRALFYAGSALLVADWAQTREISRNARWTEMNPILGRDPSRAKVNAYFALALAANWLIADKLGGKWRTSYQLGVIMGEGYAVGHNLGVGIRIHF